ncbi:MAG TPA: carboxylesterase family protein [Ferruginibacter sp.]|nr:carboxylesterase family protein [Ferruginibacter sp.]
MKKTYLYLSFISLVLVSCKKDENNYQQPLPAGIYDSMIYLQSSVQLIKDIPYTTRPNFQNKQYTSEQTKEAERTQPTLTPKLDIYLPPNANTNKKQPLLIMIHGGGYSAGDKNAWMNEAYTYSRAGYICATLNYRLTHKGSSPPPELEIFAIQCALEDIQNAIRFLKKNADTYFIDTTRIVTFGGSAGGGLSLLNAVEFDAAFGTNDHPGMTSKVDGAISTGACIENTTPPPPPGSYQYDAFDSPILMFHAKEFDSGGNGYTWTGNAVPTQQAINNSGNSCTLVAQPNMTHTVVLELRGDYWQYLKPFLWEHLRIDEL